MRPATRLTICLTDRSRSSLPGCPRKYFWATMFVAFCDQAFGNSTPRCSKAGLSGLPITASRISHSTSSKGCVPGVENRRSTTRPLRSADLVLMAVLDIDWLLSLRLSGEAAEDRLRVGRNPSSGTPQTPEICSVRCMVTSVQSRRDAIAAVKPKLRGVSHEWAFFVSLFLGAGLIVAADRPEGHPRGRHIRGQPLRPVRHQRALPPRSTGTTQRAPGWIMRRLDHSMIFLFIAGHLHAVRTAGPQRPARRRGPRGRLDRRDRRRHRRDGLDRPPEMGRRAHLHVPGMGGDHRLPGPMDLDGGHRHAAGRRRRPLLHRGCDRLRDPTPGPESSCLRLPRRLPRPRNPRRCRPVRRSRLLRPP